MSNPEPDTSVIARIMATGFNHHIRDHGPDGDFAGETTEMRDGHGFIVARRGGPFSVRVERLPAMTATTPKTPGQCWAALKRDVGTALAVHQAAATSAEDPGRAFVNAYAYVLQRMQELEA